MDPQPDFVLHLGDIVHPVPSLPTFAEAVDRFKSIASQIAMPLHVVPGNHDVGDKKVEWMPADQVCEDYLEVSVIVPDRASPPSSPMLVAFSKPMFLPVNGASSVPDPVITACESLTRVISNTRAALPQTGATAAANTVSAAASFAEVFMEVSSQKLEEGATGVGRRMVAFQRINPVSCDRPRAFQMFQRPLAAKQSNHHWGANGRCIALHSHRVNSFLRAFAYRTILENVSPSHMFGRLRCAMNHALWR